METIYPQAAMLDLVSTDPEKAARAADALYAMPDVAETFAEPRAGEAAAKSVAQNNRTAAAVLLLGYSPAGSPVLKQLLREHGDEPVKLKAWSRTVPLSVAALAALSRLGDGDARLRLLAEIPQYDDKVRVFLLDILPYIDSPEVWQALSECLHDTREIPEGVPSGAARRRVCDYAVDAFANRLALRISFAQKPGGRYGAEEVEQVLKLLRQNVPR
jgi:hypothetical protein